MQSPYNKEELFNKLSSLTEIRSWQSDMFALETPQVTEMLAKYVNHGDIGKAYDKKGRVWFVLYDSYMPWYKKVKELMKEGKNPVLALSIQSRCEAMKNGSFHAVIE